MISRIGRKRRERRAQTQPDHPFAIEACEYLTDGAFALLRVSGSGDVAPVSLVTQGNGPEAFDPLPQPDGGPKNGFWNIAFALPIILRIKAGSGFEAGAWSLGGHYRWIAPISVADSMFFKCPACSGVSRTIRTSRRRSFNITSADRDIRLAVTPDAISAMVFTAIGS